MDDDPEPSPNQLILESRDLREQLLSFGEQKGAAEISEENALEGGDIGPAVDPESPKRSVSVKDLPVQTESKASIFRRKEWRDQSQQADLSSSVKSSTTSLRKSSRRSSQRLIDQESRRGSQQPANQQTLLGQQPSRVQAINDANAKDPSWVSQRTGKVMKCRSQQTSLIWDRKALSEILHPSSKETTSSKEEESEFTVGEDDITSSGETASRGSKQLEGKVSKHSSQQHLERSGFRRSSQRSSQPSASPGPKYSRAHSTMGSDSDKDLTWISQRTGREVASKAQQTSYVWGSRTASGIFSSPGQDAPTGSDKESGFSKADEVTSSGETGTEEPTTQESRCSGQQLEGSVSQQSSQQQLGRPEAHRSSRQSTELPCSPDLKSSREGFTEESATEEEPFWTSQRTGREMKCKAQQTSLIWEPKRLSDILDTCGHVSEARGVEEEDTTAGEERDPKVDQATIGDAQRHSQSLEAEKAGQDFQQTEEQKPEHRRKKAKVDQAQQTDSVDSIRRELVDRSLQTDYSESTKPSLADLRQEPSQGAEPADVQGSWPSSQGLVGLDSSCSSPQPERQDSQRGSQQSLWSQAKIAEEEESKEPSDVESEPSKPRHEASSTKGTEETNWVSQKTGRTVRNQSQQTDQSWLQYFTAKSQKLKRCISQQTEESFLQRYQAGKLKQALREHKKNHVEPDMQRCSLCGDLYGEDFLFDLDTLSSFSTMSILSTLSGPEAAGAESAEEREPSASRGDGEPPEMQPPLPQESRRSSQQVGGQESPKGAGWGSQQAVDDPTLASNAASESSSLYTEGEDKMQQTYSMISFEGGIWLNRKTGKLLVTHSQQTSQTSVPEVSETALGKPGSPAEGGLTPTADTGIPGVPQGSQQETEADGRQPSGRESRRGSRQGRNGTPQPTPPHPTGEGPPSDDEAEKLVCSRLSEATLLSVESPDVEDGPVQIYTAVSSGNGTWKNVLTGKVLASQGQQTEAWSRPSLAQDEESAEAPSRQPPEGGQVDIP